MNWKTYSKHLFALTPLILGLVIAFVIFSGNLAYFGIAVPSNQVIRLDYVAGIGSVIFGGILTFELIGVW